MATMRYQFATLMTDFGTRDPYVAQMKGVLLTVCPRAQIIDISHEVAPQSVLEGAFILSQAAPMFPPGTVHVAVVDPGVGGDRRILAARIDGRTFLAPDNGLLSLVIARGPLEELVAVRAGEFLPPAASTTFHGRDVFAPLAGQVLNGLDIARLGPQPQTYKHLDIAAPRVEADEMVGQVIYIDRFGNLVSNIPGQEVLGHAQAEGLRVSLAGQEVGGLQGAYCFTEPGHSLAVINSMGLLEIAVNGGSAKDTFHCTLGAEVRVKR